MIEHRSARKLLNETPVTETAPWIVGEPSLQDLLGDPVVHAVLRRDGLSTQDLMRAITRGRHRLAGTPSIASAAIPMAPAVETLSREPQASDPA